MKKVLLFAGTSEGRILAEHLSHLGVETVVCVATSYGEQLMGKLPHVRVLCGRLDEEQMEGLLGKGFSLVVDATHPYAQVVSRNLQKACGEKGIPLVRLVRPAGGSEECRFCADLDEVLEALEATSGNILLTTGSKDLPHYTRLSNWQERLFPRILPDSDAIAKAAALGYPRSHLICMQGPFSRELNAALIHQFQIRVMVTKDSGQAGGFEEKLEAARETGIQVILLGRPMEETGLELDEMKRYLTQCLSRKED